MNESERYEREAPNFSSRNREGCRISLVQEINTKAWTMDTWHKYPENHALKKNLSRRNIKCYYCKTLGQVGKKVVRKSEHESKESASRGRNRNFIKKFYCRSQRSGDEKGRKFDNLSSEECSHNLRWPIRTFSQKYPAASRFRKGAKHTCCFSGRSICGCDITEKLSVPTGSEHITLVYMYSLRSLSINIVSCFRLDEREVTFINKIDLCYLAARQDVVSFDRLNKRESDGLFVPITRCRYAEKEVCCSVGLDESKVHSKMSSTLLRPVASV